MAPLGAPKTDNPVVLIVDDVADNLVAFEAMLRRDDIDIVTVSSGRAALEVLLKQDVALAIVDVQMPEMDGFALADLMRGVERTRYVPIIFVTAGAQERARVFQGYEAGAVDFLFKPVDPQILRGKVEVFATLERQRQRLREQDRMREMFIGILGHDLRNPLSGITMAATILLGRCKEDALREPVERILTSSQRMARMVEQLLDLTRMRLGEGVALQTRPCDLRQLVDDVIGEAESTRRRCQVDVQGDSAGTWDPDRMLQVAANLVGNAVQHSPAGSAIQVTIDGSAPSQVVLRVHNLGAPIPESLRPVLFDAFRGQGKGERGGGLGLGLYITHQLVLAHRGTLDFESSAAAGTTFTAALPRRAPGVGVPIKQVK
ncbi:MAG: HAMP domain-containing histidine kinase [Deltaproteobacteria bacterium]|nr:HAMP domain-containing histidine kinase [Deltaproteobacteria bacterium]